MIKVQSRTITRLVCGLAAATECACIHGAEEVESELGFNPRFSTDQTENQMVLDRDANPLYESRLFAPIADWRDSLAEPYGLQWSLDYSSQFMRVTDSIGPDSASGGMVRFFGSWDLFGREGDNTGTLLWKVEHRHSFSDTPVSALGFASGYAGLFEPPFSDQGSRMTNLYWKQKINQGLGAVAAGFLDLTDFVDVYLLASPWTGFNDYVFSTGSAAMDLPNESALGIAAGHMLGAGMYIQGGIADANADPTSPFSSIWDGGNFFKYIEIGWTPGQEKIYFDNAHVTLWHTDARTSGTPSGWGFNLSYQRWIDDKWLPFIRYGYADESGSLLESSFSIGVGYQPVPMRGVIGLGINWGKPNQASFGDVSSQFTGEVYWRYQISKEVAVTPSIQLIQDPALNSDSSSMWAFGLRVRIVL